MKKLIIFGTDDFAQLARFYFDADSDYTVFAFVVDPEYHKCENFCDLPVVRSYDVYDRFPCDEYDMFIAIAYTHLNEIREKKYHEYKDKGYRLATYISSRATYWDEGNSVGDNCFIFEDNTIQPYVTIGNNTILWSGNHIGHHATIGDNVFIASHAVLSGRTVVGNNSFVGVNATVNDHVHIAERNIIGSGALITRDTLPDSVYKAHWTDRSDKDAKEIRFFY